jgi:hypothetical protein
MIRVLGGGSLFVSREASHGAGAGKQNSMGHADGFRVERGIGMR